VCTLYPSLTFLQALSRIGGIIAWIKVLAMFMYLLHGFLFERRLSRLNLKLEEHQALPSTSKRKDQ
jgi:hypothetical protein